MALDAILLWMVMGTTHSLVAPSLALSVTTLFVTISADVVDNAD